MNCFLNASDGLSYIVISVCVFASREHDAVHSQYPIVASDVEDLFPLSAFL